MAGPIRPSGALLRADLARGPGPHRADGRRSARARGQARGDEAAARLDRRPAGSGRCPGPRRRWRGAAAAGLHAIAGGVTVGVSARPRESGQAVVLAIGGSFALIAAALALVAIAGAVTGKGRTQRAADLAAISAARSMRDDLAAALAADAPERASQPRAHGQADLPSARPPRGHRRRNGERGGGDEAAGRLSRRPLLRPGPGQDLGLGRPGGTGRRVEAKAEAEAAAAAGALSSPPSIASGGGYSGPLTYRQGEPMRPDVATAFDRMAAAAAAAGVRCGQLRLSLRRRAGGALRRQPRPALGRPARHSLHRCATELDLGPARRLRLARRERRAASASSSATPGRPGTTASTAARRRARRPGNSVAAPGGDGAVAGGRRPAELRPRPFRAPLLARPPAGTSPRRCSPRS